MEKTFFNHDSCIVATGSLFDSDWFIGLFSLKHIEVYFQSEDYTNNITYLNQV